MDLGEKLVGDAIDRVAALLLQLLERVVFVEAAPVLARRHQRVLQKQQSINRTRRGKKGERMG